MSTVTALPDCSTMLKRTCRWFCPYEWVKACTASSAHWLVYIGTQRAGAATIAPTTYIQMLVATVLGWWWFGDVPDIVTLAGAAIIIGAGLILWWTTPQKRIMARAD
mgnify:CR=1 FL=1